MTTAKNDDGDDDDPGRLISNIAKSKVIGRCRRLGNGKLKPVKEK